jgi:GntR family transcriptional regulator, rspAB operon transcriptional repressor
MQAPAAPSASVVAMPVTRRASVSVQIEQAIRERILAVELQPGTAISENEFAGQFRVSRTPVREAFIALAKEGLIDIFPQYGSFVARIALSRVAQAQFVRLTLETTALARAPARMAARAVPELRRILAEALTALAGGDMQRFYGLDDAFHATLVNATGYPLVVDVCRFIGNDIARIRHLRLPFTDYTQAILSEHACILAALDRGDIAAAGAALTEHLENTFIDIEHVRRDYPGYLTEDS